MSIIMTPITIKGKPILGMFGKGIKGSIAFNYGNSCGPDCDLNCPFHIKSISLHAKSRKVRCYAYSTEHRGDRGNLLNKLDRHQSTNRDDLTASAISETKRIGTDKIPWIRVSAFGSVPAIPPSNFRQFCLPFADGKRLHLPIESYAKTIICSSCGYPDGINTETAMSLPWIECPQCKNEMFLDKNADRERI